jgi:hypothetical protein
MRLPPAIPDSLVALLRRQEGVVTHAQTLTAGLTEAQVRTLLRRGWTRPVRGVLAAPEPQDPFRTSLRAGLLARPDAFIAALSAARLYGLAGLTRWTLAERPQLLLPAGCTYDQRAGIELRSGLLPGERTRRLSFPCVTLDRTVCDMARQLSLDDLVCLVTVQWQRVGYWLTVLRRASAGCGKR